ncbi:MAG: SDR family oxidoreductase [Desulfarculus sp.]|nr:SDR family oxidoreductase [Desulfarculus sp.]
MPKILILGATSAIAQATARVFATEGAAFCLVGRGAERLEIVAQDLTARGAAETFCLEADLSDCEGHLELIQRADARLGGLDLALIAHGTLGDQAAGQADFSIALKELQTNFLSAVSLLTHLANLLEPRGRGALVAISSVAGDRGRQSNYIYGAAKGGLSIFLQGLRNRLAPAGVRVLTVKPGFVDTPMTAAFNKGLLWVGPEVIATCIHRGLAKGREVVYAPWFWRYIMLVIRAIPERFFKRLKL